MRLILFLILFPLCVCFADELKKIEVVGNSRLDKSSIMSQLHFGIGSDVREDNLNLLLKKLYNTNLFSDISLKLINGTLIIKVKENPILESIKINGNKYVSSSNVKKAFGISTDSIFHQDEFAMGLKRAEALYKAKGRPGTKITYRVVYITPDSVEVLVQVKEKKAVKINRIRFFGNKKFTDLDLQKVITSKEFTFFRIFSSSCNYVEEKVEFDIAVLKRFYQSNGYFDFRVKELKKHQDKEKIYLDFYVSEGKEYKFGKISIKNDIEENLDLDSVMDLKTGNTFNIDYINNHALKIVNHLNNKGYLFINVTPEYVEDGDNINIVFNIREAKKVYINNINITGNKRTMDSVIRRELLFAERDPYNLNKITSSRRNILALGFFDAADIINKPIDDQNIDIDINIKERTTGYINLSGGYGSDIGFFGSFAFTEGNLLGTGDKLGLALKKSFKDFESSIDFTKIKLFDTKIDGQFSVFSNRSDKEHESSYKMSINGFRVGVGYNITDNLYNNVYYLLRSTNIYDAEDAAQSIQEQAGRSNVSSIGYKLSYNVLNNYIDPTAGYVANLSQSIAGIGGDVNFIRSEYKISYFKGIIKDNLIFNFSTSGGYIFGYGGQTVKIGQRFFIDVRGFENSGIGPRDVATRNALGGKAYMLNTAQVEFPLGLPRELDLKGAFFLDNAVLTKLDETAGNIRDTGTFRNSVGVSIIWGSPLGKLRVDFGYPITKDDLDKTKVIKFGIVSAI